MIINPNIIPDIINILTILGTAFLVTLWVGLIIWTLRDIRKRTHDFLPALLSGLVVVLLFIPGIVIYLLLRPQKTIEEDFQTTLEEEALLHTIEETPLCPGCNRKIETTWIICPTCHTRLSKVCSYCKENLALGWDICPYCAQPAPSTTGSPQQRAHPMDENTQQSPRQ